MVNRLPLRTRLFLALATVGLLPALVFGVLAVDRATSAAHDQQRAALLDLANLASANMPATVDDAAVARLAGLTGRGVTVFTTDGRVVASSGTGALTTAPPGWTPTASPYTGSVGGSYVAIVPLAGAASGSGYLALAQQQAAAPDVGVVLAVALTLTVLWAVFLSFALARTLVRPLSDLADTLERLQAGDLTARLTGSTACCKRREGPERHGGM